MRRIFDKFSNNIFTGIFGFYFIVINPLVVYLLAYAQIQSNFSELTELFYITFFLYCMLIIVMDILLIQSEVYYEKLSKYDFFQLLIGRIFLKNILFILLIMGALGFNTQYFYKIPAYYTLLKSTFIVIKLMITAFIEKRNE
ncbi:MAG: hypothetical protein R3Y64_10630 [Peptostreptococcaceae bacterium]